MKKIIYLFFFTVLLFLQLTVQSSSYATTGKSTEYIAGWYASNSTWAWTGTAWILGGNNAPNLFTFGTISNDRVDMIINNNPIMQLFTNGNVGVGDYSSFTPGRQLDVYKHNGDPQLRLTYDNYAIGSSYIWTDFLTNSSGDLIISPYNSTTNPTAHYVGINVSPTQMLDVGGNARIRALGSSGAANTTDLVLADNNNGVLGTLRRGPQINPYLPILQSAQNGLIVNTSGHNPVELGSYTLNDPLANLLHNTYIPLDSNNIWFQDYISAGSGNPTIPLLHNNNFKIGNKFDLNNTNIGSTIFTGAKFTISDVSEYCTAFISNNSSKAKFGLYVDQSNWLYSPNNNTDFYYGIYSHIGGGVNSTYGIGSLSENIAIFGNIDTSEAKTNIGVKSQVSGKTGNGILNTDGNLGFFSEVTYNNPGANPNTSQANIGLSNKVQFNNSAGFNLGVTLTVGSNNNNGNLNQINKGYFAEVAGNLGAASNRGVDIRILHNNDNNNSSQINTGFFGEINGNDASGANYGAKLEVTDNNDSQNANQNNYGVYALVDDNGYSNFNYGIYGQASNTNSVLNVGVAGIAMYSSNGVDTINNNLPATGNIGVYGFAPDNGNYGSGYIIPNGIAGYFSGALIYTGSCWNPSDEKLKEKVNNADSALYKLSLLNPKTYYFKSKDFPGMALPHTQQYGLLAQDVANIFPTLVGDFVNPALLDTTGKELYPSVSFKAINYQAFIPLLIQSVKELNGKNDSLKMQVSNLNKNVGSLKQINDSLKTILAKYDERFNNIESVLRECCRNNKSTGMNEDNRTDINSTIKIVPDNSINGNKTELYQNKPNPFKTITTFTYSLGTTGFVELEITDQYGQFIEKLVNTNQETGNYSIDWDSVKVAPGMYFYSLKVNGLLLVKKAIKVN